MGGGGATNVVRELLGQYMGGGGTDVDLSHGALAAMLRVAAEGLRPVLQVADAPRRSLGVEAEEERYLVLLSDGVHSQVGMLAASLSHLVRDGDLRRGTVVRVLDYICSAVHGERFIIVNWLEILQTECAPIGCPTIYGANPTPPSVVSCFGVLDSKMHQLSLDDHQNQRFPVTTTVENFGPSSTSGSPVPPFSLLPPPVCTDRSCDAMNEAPYLVTPVAVLNPHIVRWTIKVRVTAKTDLRQYGNIMKIFSFDLLDAQGGEIRATCVNSQVDRYFDLIEVGKVYLISRGTVKPEQTHRNPLNNDYRILLHDSTSIKLCSEDDSSIPRQKYNFRQISEVEKIESGSLVDVLGVVTSASPYTTIIRKYHQRKLELKDMSGRSVEITLLRKFSGREGQELQCLFDSGSNPILAVKGCRVSDMKGKSLATISSSTQLKVNPDIPEAERLRQWYLTEGKMSPCISLSQSIIRNNVRKTIAQINVRKTIAQINDESWGQSGKPDLITVRATISHVNATNFCYPACTLEYNGKQCNRKVTRNNDGTWNCNRCVLDLPKCEYRYLLMCQLQDHTGVTYATACQEAATKIIGYSAEELFILRDQDEAKWEEIMLGVCWQEYVFKLNIEEETLYGELRVRCDIVGAEKVHIGRESLSLKRDANSLGTGLETFLYRLRI